MSKQLGMSRRELERELAWILRNPPTDPRELAKALASAMVTLIDKNNERIAASMAHDDTPDVQEEY